MLFAYGIFYPEGGEHALRGQAHRLRRPHGRRTIVFERPDWWVNQVRRGRRLLPARRSSPTATIDYARLPDASSASTADKLARDCRQETDTISRLVYGFATAYLLTGEDRFLEAAEKGTEYLREHMRVGRRGRGHRLLVPRHRHLAGGKRAEDPRLGVRRRLRRHPGVRADLRARRPDADLPHHRRPAHPERHRDDGRPVRPVLPRPGAGRLLLAPRPDHARPAQRVARRTTGAARTGTRSATTRRRT